MLGASCSGKSSLCNTIAGKQVREINTDEESKREIQICETVEGIVMIDAPGYEDLEGGDRQILVDVITKANEIGHINLLIYCINVN